MLQQQLIQDPQRAPCITALSPCASSLTAYITKAGVEIHCVPQLHSTGPVQLTQEIPCLPEASPSLHTALLPLQSPVVRGSESGQHLSRLQL